MRDSSDVDVCCAAIAFNNDCTEGARVGSLWNGDFYPGALAGLV